MQLRKLTGCLVALAFLMSGFPAQAEMVTTAQMQSSSTTVPINIAGQRDWILQQLIGGGVTESNASMRVAALTDAQIAQLHQRIDQKPAGGNIIIVGIVVVLVSELLGWTDFIPVIRPAD